MILIRYLFAWNLFRCPKKLSFQVVPWVRDFCASHLLAGMITTGAWAQALVHYPPTQPCPSARLLLCLGTWSAHPNFHGPLSQADVTHMEPIWCHAAYRDPFESRY